MHFDEETLYSLDRKRPDAIKKVVGLHASVKADAQCCATAETSELEE